MKFNCGLTKLEKQIKKDYNYLIKMEALKIWHNHFVWWPIQLSSNDCRWLEYIQRKGTCHGRLYDPDYWTWEYRAVK